MTDDISEAIKRTAPPRLDTPPMAAPPLLLEVSLDRTGGRVVGLAVPPDIRTDEMLEFIGWLINGLPKHLEQQKSRIHLIR